MSSSTLQRSAIATAILVLLAIFCWEIYLRKSGSNNSFDDDSALWAHQRGRVYLPKESSTVFIGSSRIKFDLDIPTWQSTTGDQEVQLAIVGSTPLPVLDDLANDPLFKGKLIVDVTEILFFSSDPSDTGNPKKYVKYYHDITPTQRASFWIGKPLEQTFVFLDKDNYSLNALLDKLRLKNRPGVFAFPIFPRDFDRTDYNRQSYMMPAFVSDTQQHNQVRDIWAFFASLNKTPPISGAPLDSLLEAVKVSTDKIKSRGGTVLFVRTPSSGPFWDGEQKGYPRDQYWDRLLTYTDCPGIHFMDDPATNHYVCPEFSHLTPADAKDYTLHLIRTLREQHGWKFPKDHE